MNKGHGRVERRRQCWATSDPSEAGHANDRGEWANMNSAAMIESALRTDGETTVRRPALNPAKGEKSLKIGAAAKRKRAGWDLEYPRAILRLAQ